MLVKRSRSKNKVLVATTRLETKTFNDRRSTAPTALLKADAITCQCLRETERRATSVLHDVIELKRTGRRSADGSD